MKFEVRTMALPPRTNGARKGVTPNGFADQVLRLEKDQVLLVPFEEDMTAAKQQSRVSSRLRAISQRHSEKFATRIMESGIGVWRVQA